MNHFLYLVWKLNAKAVCSAEEKKNEQKIPFNRKQIFSPYQPGVLCRTIYVLNYFNNFLHLFITKLQSNFPFSKNKIDEIGKRFNSLNNSLSARYFFFCFCFLVFHSIQRYQTIRTFFDFRFTFNVDVLKGTIFYVN